MKALPDDLASLRSQPRPSRLGLSLSARILSMVVIVWWAFGTLCSIAAVGGLAYVILHFVTKFW